MAVAVDAVSTIAQSGSSGSLTHTPVGVPSGVLVAVHVRGGPATVTGVTYGGAAMSAVPGGDLVGGTTVRTSVWYLDSPPPGAQTVTVTQGSADPRGVTVVTVTGSDHTAPLGPVVASPGTGTAPSGTASAASGDLVIDALTANNKNTTATAGAGQTDLANYQGAGTTGSRAAVSSAPGAASVQMKWTLSASVDYAHVAVPIKAASAPTARARSFAVWI